MGRNPMSSLFGQPAPLKWVRLNSWIWVSEKRYPDGEAVGVSGLNCTIPNGATGPGTVLPPAPPGTGLGELLSSVPMNGLTCWVSGMMAAAASAVIATAEAVVRSRDRTRARGLRDICTLLRDNVVNAWKQISTLINRCQPQVPSS